MRLGVPLNDAERIICSPNGDTSHGSYDPELTNRVLAERVTDRLLALGYDRIEFITAPEELELDGGEGEVRIEARRGGAPHKGRVTVRDGKIVDVQLRSSYEIFP